MIDTQQVAAPKPHTIHTTATCANCGTRIARLEDATTGEQFPWWHASSGNEPCPTTATIGA
jgi:hypothetical protein